MSRHERLTRLAITLVAAALVAAVRNATEDERAIYITRSTVGQARDDPSGGGDDEPAAA
jgi:uncharacterized protein (UPF0212 family)